MGIDSKRPPLPAPTDSLVDNSGPFDPTDAATDLSIRTDRTHYSLPDDGTPIKISTKRLRSDKTASGSSNSQTSLLIEYFDGSKSGDKSSTRPSVRVKVTPSAKKMSAADSLKISEVGKDRQPSYTRRISLGGGGKLSEKPEKARSSSANTSRVAPVEVEFLNQSEVSSEAGPQARYIESASNISSIPPDSLLDGPVAFKSPKKSDVSFAIPTSQQRFDKPKDTDATKTALLQEPLLQRSRSKSRERIAQKVIEKLNQDREAERLRERQRLQRLKEKGGSREIFEHDLKGHSNRSSTSYKDSEVDSSLLKPRDIDSSVSGASKVSLNNPKLLRTIEEAILRILPEIETQRRQSVKKGRSRHERDSYTSESTASRTDESELSRPKVVLNRDKDDPGLTLSGDTVRRKHRHRSSREYGSERGNGRDLSSKEYDRERRHKYRSSRDSRHSHGSEGEKVRSKEHRRREHREQGSESGSRTNSIATTEDEYYGYSKIPPMPMRSELQDSDITRDSLLSAETNDTGTVASSGVSRREPETLIKEVSRGSPQTARPHLQSESYKRDGSETRDTKSPKVARSHGELSTKSSRSDQSSSGRVRAAKLTAAGLTGAAAALYGHDKAVDRNSRRSVSSESKHSKKHRDPSPDQSTSNVEQVPTQQARDLVGPSKEPGFRGGLSPEPLHVRKQSVESEQSGTSAQYPLTSKRHQAISLEEPEEVLANKDSDDEEAEPVENDIDDFYYDQHKLNDEYRSSVDHESNRDSMPVDEFRNHDSPQHADKNDSAREQDLGGPPVRLVTANQGYIDSPLGVESAVASLVEPSIASSDVSRDKRFSSLSYPETPNENREVSQEPISHDAYSDQQNQQPHNPYSRNRWTALRENAQALSNTSKEQLGEDSPRQSLDRSVRSDESLKLGASGIPVADDPMPEIGHGFRTQSPALNESLHQKPSVIEGPLGDQTERRGHWPYEPTPSPPNTGGEEYGQARYGSRDLPFEEDMAAGLAGATAVATGLGIEAMGSREQGDEPKGQYRDARADSFASTHEELPVPQSRAPANFSTPEQDRVYKPNRDIVPTSGTMKDEGYISEYPPRSSEDGTPLSFSKPPPRLFDDKGQPSPAVSEDDPFVNDKRLKYISADSRGMPSQYYDAATGRGMNHIESKDVVALMDHLTVRDGHRNARDTEILVTLVRLTAEMQNNFEDIKKFIEDHSNIIQDKTDQAANRTSDKLLAGSSRGFSSVPSSRAVSGTTEDIPAKRKNIFKRAIQGLKSKSTTDLTNMEAMMKQLLFEVERLKERQDKQQNVPLHLQQNILDSYERLRAAPDSGYEPEGQAGTSSTPSRSVRGTVSPQVRNSQQSQSQSQPQTPATRMHSGYYNNRESNNRISTVIEDDEDIGTLNEQDEDGMQTPTQEAQQQRARSYNTPQRSTGERGVEFTPDTNVSGENKYRHRSSNSWASGIPRISRWSKTTTSSDMPEDQDDEMSGKSRPYSFASRSGSDVNVLPRGDQPYNPAPDERLRSVTSLNQEYEREQQERQQQERQQQERQQQEMHEQENTQPSNDRSSSPLIPGSSVMSGSIMDDPKYRAQRNSLTLQHPQPRQGPTRHPSNLEDQAYSFRETHNGMTSPADSDAFGSNPSLARYPGRFGNSMYGNNGPGNLSPISSDVAASQRQSYQPPRPPKIRDDGPLVPPKLPLDSGNSATTSSRGVPDGRYTNTADENSPESPQDSYQSRDSYRSTGSAGEDYYLNSEDSPQQQHQRVADRNPQGMHGQQREYGQSYYHGDDGEDDDEDIGWHHSDGYNPIPLERKRSPYSPGGLLDPIEERYSMEGDRSSLGVPHTSGLEDVAEEEERTLTPDLPPRMAARVGSEGGAGGQLGQRRITGPREMPGSTSHSTR